MTYYRDQPEFKEFLARQNEKMQTKKNFTPEDLIGSYKRTNADRIRSMTDEEMVEVIVEWCPDPEIGKCEYAPYKDLCKQCWLNWLKQEVKE